MIETRAPVAQWIERRPPEPKVAGSNPVGRAIATFSGSASANPCAYAAGVSRTADDPRPCDDDPFVYGVDHVGFLLCYLGLLPRLGEGLEPFDRATRRQVPGRLRPNDFLISAEACHPREVGRVVEASRGMVQGELADLAFDPGPIHGHGTLTRGQHRRDLGAHGGVDSDRPELGDDGVLPRRRGNAGFRTPRLARRRCGACGAGRPSFPSSRLTESASRRRIRGARRAGRPGRGGGVPRPGFLPAGPPRPAPTARPRPGGSSATAPAASLARPDGVGGSSRCRAGS